MSIRNASMAIAALLAASSAVALEVSSGATGQAVLLPYYSVHDGLSTLFSVTNHSDAAKAVRIAIAEGGNGRAALTFNVYLGPWDSWSGALSASSSTEETPPLLRTGDASCTTGTFSTAGVPLRVDAFSGANADGLGDDPIRLHQGQIEIIEMGTLSGQAALQAANGLCDAIRARFLAAGAWENDPNVEVGAPSGGLSAEVHLVDVQGGAAFDVGPIAFDGFSGAARHTNDHRLVRIYKPTLAPGQAEFVVDGKARFPADRAADAVSFGLMAAQLEGAFLLSESIDASTRWAVSFPTRPAYVDNRPGGELAPDTPLLPPFAGDSSITSAAATCSTGSARTIDLGGVLGAARQIPLCYQVIELPVWRSSPPAGLTPILHVATDGLESGRLRLEFDPSHALTYTTMEGGTAVAKGLPAVAYSLMEARNTQAQPGRLATYAMTGNVVRVK